MLSFPIAGAAVRDTLDLSGIWQYRLTGVPTYIAAEGEIVFPGTLDEQHKSIYTPEGDNTTQLRREFSYVGEATYTRDIEIPKDWKEKHVQLTLERTKPTVLLVDGKRIGSNSRISSSQNYELTGIIPGKHRIELIVNNADSIPPIVARSSHAVSEATQTNWSGLLGKLFIEAKPTFHISGCVIDDGNLPQDITVTVEFSKNAPSGLTINGRLDGKLIAAEIIPAGVKSMEFKISADSTKLWSSLHPHRVNIDFEILNRKGEPHDFYSLTTGLRKFQSENGYFTVNDNPVFLRGTVNAAVYPLTGYAPLDKESWKNYFNILKDYGLNHVRFHSWTPPQAAFEAADEVGIYILTELPIWGELDRDLKFHNRFLREELKGIMESYSHHPSLVMFSPGNELWGDISLMGEYMKEARDLNPRIAATYGSNLYLGMNGEIGGEDFVLSAKTSDDVSQSVRGSVSFADSDDGGHFNSMSPSNDFDYSSAITGISVPVISHEVGQYQSYPDFSEIEKYTGNLKPDNLKEFRKRAIEAGTYRKNKDFVKSSGEWAAKLYRAEIEAALRTPGMGGIELFGLQDYPGQGTALVGLLDPFMDSKGFITPEEWRKSSSDLVLMADFPKFSFTEGERVEVPIKIANYTENSDTIDFITWKTDFASGNILVPEGSGLVDGGIISLKMPKVASPVKKTLKIAASGGKPSNSYDFWIYPSNVKPIDNVRVTDNMTEVLILLEQGERVLLCPDSATVAKASLGGLFTPDFWNYRMYRSICDEMNLAPSPGTLGLFVNASHPAFKKFPTDTHTDWQWYPIVSNSRPLIIDRLPKDFDPLIEVIDNVERNFRLSLMLECNVGKGKLILLSVDKDKIMESPEGRWLMQSAMEYLSGKEFKPKVTLTPEQLVNLITKPSNARLIKELKNETYNSHW